jgi:hypothetical protein
VDGANGVTAETRALKRARDALARLDRAASRVPCLDLVLYRSARIEAIRRGDTLHEHAPGVPAVDPAEQPPIAAVLRGEAWLGGGRPGGWRGLLCDLHWELMQGCDPTPGALRSGASWAQGSSRTRVARRFPEANSVPSGLSALDDALREEPDPLLAAAGAYAQLFLLHPFRNGNGRVIQAIVPVLLRERGLLSRPCLLLGGTFDRAKFAALILSGDVQSLVAFALSTIESAATDAAAACEAIRERFEADEHRLPPGVARRLLWRLAERALPVRDVAVRQQDALRALRAARIVSVTPGLFDEPMVFHVGLAGIVACGMGARRLTSTP